MRDGPTDDMDLRTDRPMNGWTYGRKVEQTQPLEKGQGGLCYPTVVLISAANLDNL